MEELKKFFSMASNQETTFYLIGKRYNIDQNDEIFRCLYLNNVDDYLFFKRVCELNKSCVIVEKEGGCFDIKIEMYDNSVLLDGIKKEMLTRKVVDKTSVYDSIEHICTFRIYK